MRGLCVEKKNIKSRRESQPFDLSNIDANAYLQAKTSSRIQG